MRHGLCTSALILGLLLAAGVRQAQSQYCTKCAGDEKSCGPGDSTNQYCCCAVSCSAPNKVPVCTCSNWCTWCGNCNYHPCNYQSKTCSQGLRDVSPDHRPAGARFFRYTEFSQSLLRPKSLLVYHLLLNLSKDAHGQQTGWIGRDADATEPRQVTGYSNDGFGTYAYSATVDVQDGYVIVDVVSQPDRKRPKVRYTHAEIWEESPVNVEDRE